MVDLMMSKVSAHSAPEVVGLDHSAFPVSLGMGDNMNVNASQSNLGRNSYQSANLKPPTFDGTSSWTDYLIQFEMVSELNGWDQPTMAMCLGASLRRVAQSVLGDLDYRG